MAKASVKDALSSLLPIEYNDVPLDNLPSFFRTAFTNAELIVNSVPPPASTSNSPSAISPPTTPNAASKGIETVCSPTPNPLDDRYVDLQKTWGKPYKMSAKDNPLNIAVYKTSANDKHGAWFARRSVHQGLGFEKWKRSMKREFGESMKVKGGPGSGAVRGIGADRRVLKQEVGEMGNMEVFQLSAVFPGPVTPREFLTLLLTSDNALSEASTVKGSSGKPPRHYIVISRPTTHSDAPERTGLVKGTYESIEIIREFSRPDHESEDPELNPVEWIMITRSDPGGGIPRFMVERGTPSSIVGDTMKFLDWACKQSDTPPADEAEHEAEVEKNSRQVEEETIKEAPPLQGQNDASANGVAPPGYGSGGPQGQDGEGGGIISSITSYVGTTASSYLPYFHQSEIVATTDSEGGSSSDDDEEDPPFEDAAEGSDAPSSPVSTMHQEGPGESTEQLRAPEDNRGHERNLSSTSLNSSSAASISTQSISAALANGKEPSNHHEKELLKLQQKKVQLDEKLAKTLESDKIKAAANTEKEEKELKKAQEKHQKEKQKQEQKYIKDLEKLEEKRKKEEAKAEEKRRKALEKDVLTKAHRERDDAKERCQVAEKENELLKKHIEELQKDKTILTEKLAAAEARSSAETTGPHLGVAS